jgi:hypothetical protein
MRSLGLLAVGAAVAGCARGQPSTVAVSPVACRGVRYTIPPVDGVAGRGPLAVVTSDGFGEFQRSRVLGYIRPQGGEVIDFAVSRPQTVGVWLEDGDSRRYVGPLLHQPPVRSSCLRPDAGAEAEH